MKKLVLILLVFGSFFLLSAQNTTRYINSSYSNNDPAVLNQLVSALADQLTQNKNFVDIQKSAIAITSFVSLDNLKVTSRLSNILSENLIHEMQVRGYKVIDFKTMESIVIDKKGDFLFSRDLSKLRKSLNVDYALTGTYVDYRNGTVINARIIDLRSHVILSTAQILIPRSVAKRARIKQYKIPNFKPNIISLSK